MTQTGYADSIVNGMLSWLKGFASWVLKLFDLAGRGGISPLGWLSDNWLKLLIFFVICGVLLDWGVWLIRWRPYWVWFKKKRIIVDDDDFFTGEELVESGMYDQTIFGKHVAESEALRALRTEKQKEKPAQGATLPKHHNPPHHNPPQPERVTAKPAVPHRRPDGGGTAVRTYAPQDEPTRRTSFVAAKPQKSAPRPHAAASAEKRDIFEQQDLFSIHNAPASHRRIREDEVFNVANLPGGGKKRLSQIRRPVLIKREEETDDDDLFKVE